ncbi:hypothetical protein [Acinetobacter indicus]|uniref:hypothetical protein n=1 Tax=Acinetobacter indicus TaxID=756892 RepID=UPI003989B648
MNFNTKCGVGAVLKLIVRKADTNEIVRETPEFHNLVLTTGLARMAVGNWVDRCVVGTGNSTPVASQVALDNFLASTTTTAAGVSDTGGIQVTTAPYYWFGRRTWRFGVGTAVGNISEVGLGWGNTTLWNRALIRDELGNPTTITVLSDEYLDVISEVRVFPSESESTINLKDKLGNVISTHSVKVMPYFKNIDGNVKWSADKIGFGASSDFIRISSGAMPISPTELPTSSNGGVGVSQSYNETTLTGRSVVTSSQYNFNHRTFFTCVKGVMTQNPQWVERVCGFKWEITPPIPKDNETILTYEFTLSWSGYESS